MRKKNLLFICLLAGISLLTASCGSREEPTPTVDPAAVMTEVAMTVSADLAQEALLTPSPTATMPTTATPPPIPTQALPPAPTSPAGQPAVQPTAIGPQPDNFVLISETVPDDSVYWKNERFTKTWKLENTGTTTWDSSYTLFYWDGEIMSDITAVSIKNAVQPGVQIDISVPMVAPSVVGKTYTMYWKMHNGKGTPFGDTIWVQIYVGTEADKTPTPSG